jgi:Fe-S cluster assembly protein SufD
MASTTASPETQFAEEFRKFLESEGGGDFTSLRKEAFACFSGLGFPTSRNENWKYTNVAQVARESWTVPAAVATAGVGDHKAKIDSFRLDRNGFTALNAAFGQFTVGVIPKETSVEEPILIEYGAAAGQMFAPHAVIVAEAGSKATLIEICRSDSPGFTNAAVQIFVEDNANLTHYRVQKNPTEGFNYGVTEVSLGRGSRYDSTNINLGAGMSRHDIDLKFTAEGGEAWVDGLYMLSGNQHHDTHSIIDHTVPNCTSHQTYKGIMNDKSRGVFNGIVFVRENASGTDAQQSNKNLLLSNEARVDTKPQLEIFNDDVKCSHGATVGQLEEEELFYLLTRGLPQSLARNLLTYGFAEEVINKIGIESIKSELDGAVLNRLGAAIE